MASALLCHLGNGAFDVQSAGISVRGKQDASFYAKSVLKEEGIELHHSSQQAHEELMQWADVILTMTEQHKQVLAYHFPDVEKRIHTLCEFVGEGPYDISDPFGGTVEMYRHTYDELKRLIQKMI